MKTTICALALGAATLLGCNAPTETRQDGRQVIVVPQDCYQIVSLTKVGGSRWSLMCRTEQSQEVFYNRHSGDDHWRRYEVVRE